MIWGVFDSGVGGLTVVRALMRALPDAPLVYLGDTARVPYGIRSRATVRRYAREAAHFFENAGVDGLIVACNTASAVALDEFSRDFDGPTIGVVEPGVDAALAATRTGKIGVIGTAATIRSDAYAAAIRAAAPHVAAPHAVVSSTPCPMFVPLAEEGWIEGDVPEMIARHYLERMIDADVDTVILGCTHYPLLAPVIGRVLGESVRLVDSAEAVAQRAMQVTEASSTNEREKPRSRYCVTDAGGAFADVARRFLGDASIELETVGLGAAESPVETLGEK